MNKAYFLPLVIAVATTAMANDYVYTNFLNGVKSVTSGGVPTADGGSWNTEGVELSQKSATSFEFNTRETTMSLTVGQPGPADTNTSVKVELEVSLADVDLMDSASLTSAQTAFAVCTNAYHAWNGSNWVVLDEVPEALFDAETTNLTVEICYQGTASRKARFTIGNTVLMPRSSDDPWITLVTQADNFAGLRVNGSGVIAKADASVMLGYAEFDGVKYGKIADAVAAAQAASGGTVDVLRPTDENVNVSSANIKIADNGNMSGEITVPENVEFTLEPSKEDFKTDDPQSVAGKSGTYTLPVTVSGGDLSVVLPSTMSNKEIAGTVVRDNKNKTVTVTIQTATTLLESAKPDGHKALAVNATLRTYLSDHAADAYEAANVSKESIESALQEVKDNGLPLYQSYALGIAPTVSVKPATVANDESSEGISLSIPALIGKTGSGDYTISYVVGSSEQTNAGNIKIPLSTGSHSVKIVFKDKE